jgi:hypothetical protein
VVIRASGSTWTKVAAEPSLQASFGFAVKRRAPQVDAPRHTATAADGRAKSIVTGSTRRTQSPPNSLKAPPLFEQRLGTMTLDMRHLSP